MIIIGFTRKQMILLLCTWLALLVHEPSCSSAGVWACTLLAVMYIHISSPCIMALGLTRKHHYYRSNYTFALQAHELACSYMFSYFCTSTPEHRALMHTILIQCAAELHFQNNNVFYSHERDKRNQHFVWLCIL